MTTQQRSKNGSSRPGPAPAPTIADVLERARKGGNGASPATSSGPGMDWNDVNQRLRDRVEFVSNMRTLDSLNRDEQPRESFGDTANGLAALITALKSEQQHGGDGTGQLLQILDYVQSKDTDTLRDEVREIREALTQPGGESFLDQLYKARELGLVRGPDSENGMLATIQVLKELGLIAGNGDRPEPPSIATQIRETLDLLNMLRPPQPAQPQSVIQFGDGQVSLSEYLAIEEYKDRREAAREERELSRQRFEAGREAMNRMFDAVGEGAAYLLASEDPDFGEEVKAKANGRPASRPARPAGQSKQQPELQAGETRVVSDKDQWTTVPCDHCGATNFYDMVKRPPTFFCSECGEQNEMTINDPGNGVAEDHEHADDRGRESQTASRPRVRVATGAGAK